MITNLVKELIYGKSLARTLSNLRLKKKDIIVSGKVLDLGGRELKWIDGKPRGASYYRFLNFRKAEILRLDIDEKTNPEIKIDFEKSNLPFQNNSIDVILVFNLLEHIYNYKFLISEIYRILKLNGEVIGSVPFLAKIHPDPNDFFRYSYQCLRNIFKEIGFSKINIEYIGFGPFVAQYSQIEFLFPRVFRIISAFISILLDKIFLRLKPQLKKRYPLNYIFILSK